MRTLTKLILEIALLAGMLALPAVCFAWDISVTLYERDGSPFVDYRIDLRKPDGTYIVEPTGFDGTYTFVDLPSGEYSIKPHNSSTAAFDPAEVTLTVNSDANISFNRLNRPPELSSAIADYTIDEADLFMIRLEVMDSDFDQLNYSFTGFPSSYYFDELRKLLFWIPSYQESGNHIITVSVADPYNGVVEQSFNITVNDKQPGTLGIVASPDSGPEVLWVDFKMVNLPQEYLPYIEQAEKLCLRWDFGNGGISFRPNPTYCYGEPGSYTAKLTVYDKNENVINQAQTNIAVANFTPDPNKTFYVAPWGDDNNPGTKEEPWLSVQKPAVEAQPGDTIYFRDGTYILKQGTYAVKFAIFGTAQQPIRFLNYPGEHPKWDGNMADKVIGLGTCTNIIIEGIEIFNSRDYLMLIHSDHVTIKNCKLHSAYIRDTIKLTDAKNIAILNNEFYNHQSNAIDGASPNRNIIIRGNLFRDPYDFTLLDELGQSGDIVLKGGSADSEVSHNILLNTGHFERLTETISVGGSTSGNPQPYEGLDIRVHDNLVLNCRDAVAIQFESAENCQAFNNTFVRVSSGIYPYNSYPIVRVMKDPRYGGFSRNITLSNNIFYTSENSPQLVHVYGGNTEGFRSDHNIWWPQIGKPFFWEITGDPRDLTLDEFTALTGNDQNSIIADPLFYDLTGDNYRLNISSPAIDAGALVVASSYDYDGNPRDTKPDIGAYEFVGPTQVLEGDFNEDGVVDIKDLILVAKNYGNPYTIKDIILVAKNYGEKI